MLKTKSKAMDKTPENSFLGHLDELRQCLVKSLCAIIVGSFIFYYFVDGCLNAMIKPVGHLVFTSVADAFLARLFLTILGGVFISLPFILYQVWKFVADALKDYERKAVMVYAPFSTIAFFAGAFFAYFVMVPISLDFLLGFGSETIVPMITIKNYISFIGTLVLAFGVIFELPLILVFLTRIGIATPAFLQQKRKYAITFIFILSALITPPDVITQLLMAGPLMVLYEIGVLASKITAKKV